MTKKNVFFSNVSLKRTEAKISKNRWKTILFLVKLPDDNRLTSCEVETTDRNKNRNQKQSFREFDRCFF